MVLLASKIIHCQLIVTPMVALLNYMAPGTICLFNCPFCKHTNVVQFSVQQSSPQSNPVIRYNQANVHVYISSSLVVV